MTKDEALKLALSTLDEVRQETFRLSRDGQKLYAEEKVWNTIIAIKEALAQPEQDGQCKRCIDGCPACDARKLPEQEPVAWEQFHEHMAGPNYVAPQQGPVAWGVFEVNLHDMFFSPSEAQEMADLKGTHAEVRPLYTTPPQREFVGLTYEEKHAIRYSHMTSAEFIECIEAKLKDKNT